MMNVWYFDVDGGRLISALDVSDISAYEGLPGYTTAEPPAVQEGQECRWIDGGWHVRERQTKTLDIARDEKWEEIKGSRDAALDAPLVTPYGTFDSDKVSRDNIANAVQLCDKLAARGLPSTVDFILYDNSTIALTVDQMGTVGLILGQKVQAAYATASELRAQINTATSIAAIEEIAWPTS